MSVQLDDPVRRGIDAQVSAIGSVLLQPELIPRLLSELRETDFDGAFRELYTAIRELYHRGAPLDPVTLTDQAGQQHRELILQILELTPSAANFAAYAEIVRKEARIQSVRSLAAELRTAASLEDMQALHDRIGDLLAGSNRRTVLTMAELMADFVRRKTEGETYITTGMSCLDGWIYLSPGDLTVIAGQPSRGKTALALQMAVNQSRERRVGFFSLETSAGKVADRLVTMYSGVSFGSIKRAKLDPGEWDAVGQATSHLAGDGGYQLEVIEAAGMTVDEIFAVAKARKHEIIYVDYLQIISGSGSSRYEVVTNISARLHTLAQQHKILTVALSQLNRGSTQGKTEEPFMSDLRESGQIEQDADAILMIYCKDKDKTDGDRILKIAKNKEGETNKVLLHWDGKAQRLTPSTRREAPPLPRYRSLKDSTPVPGQWEQTEIGGSTDAQSH